MNFEQNAKSLAVKHSLAVQIAIGGYQINELDNVTNVGCAFDLAGLIVERMDAEIAELNKQNEGADDLREVLAELLAKACR